MIESIQKLAPVPPTGLYSHVAPLISFQNQVLRFQSIMYV